MKVNDIVQIKKKAGLLEISRTWLIYSTLELESDNVNANLIYSPYLQLFHNLIRKETPRFLYCYFRS